MGAVVQFNNADTTRAYLRRPVRSFHRAIADMVMDPQWDHRSGSDKYELHQQALSLGLDFIDLRARGWKVTRLEARRRIERECWV